MISLYYDIGTFLIILIAFLIFYIKGFVSSALQLLGFAGALVLGYLAVTGFSVALYDRYVYPYLVDLVAGRIEDYLNGGEGAGTGLIGRAIKKYLEMSSATGTPEELAKSIIEGSVRNVTLTTCKVVMFIIVFIVSLLLIKLLAGLLTNLNDAPVVGKLNQILGGAFGIVIGVSVIILLSALFHILQGHFSAEWLKEDYMQNTYLYSYFYNNNPLIG